MRVVATRAIEAREPVTISYGPLASKVSKTAFAFFLVAQQVHHHKYLPIAA